MSNNRKKVCSTAEPSPSSLPVPSPSSGVFSLRIPPPLRAAADKYANDTGVSLNGLVCIALADYLAARDQGKK